MLQHHPNPCSVGTPLRMRSSSSWSQRWSWGTSHLGSTSRWLRRRCQLIIPSVFYICWGWSAGTSLNQQMLISRGYIPCNLLAHFPTVLNHIWSIVQRECLYFICIFMCLQCCFQVQLESAYNLIWHSQSCHQSSLNNFKLSRFVHRGRKYMCVYCNAHVTICFGRTNSLSSWELAWFSRLGVRMYAENVWFRPKGAHISVWLVKNSHRKAGKWKNKDLEPWNRRLEPWDRGLEPWDRDWNREIGLGTVI